jgi:hypothetical protein
MHPRLLRHRTDRPHWVSYSPVCSNTNFTDRSQTASGYLILLVMTPSSQSLEPPRNPGWFNHPLLATRGRPGEVLHARMRNGKPTPNAADAGSNDTIAPLNRLDVRYTWRCAPAPKASQKASPLSRTTRSVDVDSMYVILEMVSREMSVSQISARWAGGQPSSSPSHTAG